tara:strand:+ start:3097 stop:3468 length:372 start_codon:yes stop_codon:yes gene_type:complete
MIDVDKGGRPPFVFEQDQIASLEQLASYLTKGQLADYYGISENTFRAVEERQPEVFEAYKKGRAKQTVRMAQNLVSMAMAGNVTAAIFYLKTQSGWKEQEAEPQEIPQINIVVDSRAANAPAE